MKKIFSIFLVALLAVFTSACGANKEAGTSKDNKDKLKIYTTVYPLQYFTERIGGNHVEVSSIYPPGSNEHTFEPTQRDMMNVADADYFFYIGLGLEGFVENAKKSLQNENVKFVGTAANVSKDKLAVSTVHGDDDEEHTHATTDQHSHANNHVDPHVWMSPIISQDLALSIKNALVKAQPENKAEFEKNYQSLVKDLKDLDGDFKAMADKVPNKTFFVSHAAFGYIAGTYGLNQVSVAGLNSQDEPSQKELTKIVDQAKKDHIHYILFEQNVTSNLAKVIQNDVGAQPLTLHNLSVLTNDDIKNKEDYFTLMHRDIKTLEKALEK
ncbi:metal ABC transporter solute-binding protein, Zn/Mn family [Rummeliibacillus sp. NPDC094406]|uniref:metal ABC transporter solute-binding protein, Zn/Mn family n=1 Tax=Rummeliibacillus sp. NPDC094406 TaxID=3364511 RepID=UPI003830DB3C